MPRLLLSAFALACLLYWGGFALDQHLRTRRGPWILTFDASPSGELQVRVRQDHLRLTNTCLVFVGVQATNPATIVRFETPGSEVPGGRVTYEDLTYLPGAVTLELHGHEIELLPRTLYLDRQPIAWTNTTRLFVR